MNKISKILIIILSLFILNGIAYATVTIAKDRKSSYLPWQGVEYYYYDSSHNVGNGGNSESRFTDNGNGTVSDSITNLEWQKDGITQGTKNWDSAISYCEGIVIDGKSDWRLPNIKELMSVLDYRAGDTDGGLTQIFNYSRAVLFWTSTSFKNNLNNAWVVDCNNLGTSSHYSKNELLYVRCVR